MRPRDPNVARGEVQPLRLWRDALMAGRPTRGEQLAAIERALLTPCEAPAVTSGAESTLPGLSDAVAVWRAIAAQAPPPPLSDYARYCHSALPTNAWLSHWTASVFSGDPSDPLALAPFRWALCAAHAAIDVPAAEIVEAIACCDAVVAVMQTTVRAEGDEWVITGLRGPAPAESARAASAGVTDKDPMQLHPWGERLAFVSAGQASPPAHGEDRWPYSIRVPQDDVLLVDDVRRMPVVLAALGSALSDFPRRMARHDDSTRLPALLVDAPLAPGVWSGHAFAMRDLAVLHVELRLTI